MTTARIWAVSYLALVAALIGLAIYTRTVDQETQACIANVVRENSISSTARSAAAQRKDNAERDQLQAMRDIIRLRLPEARNSSDVEVLNAASRYLEANSDYLDASRELQMARAHNPIPKFDNYCQNYRKHEK